MSTEHPDFEALSAHLDGEASTDTDPSEVEAHLAGCAECRRTVRWLRTAAALVATPVPPLASDAKEAALARAQAGFGAAAAAPPSAAAPAATSTVGPVPIGSAPSRRRGGIQGWAVGIGSVAAVLLAVIVGVGVLTSGNEGDTGATVAAGPDRYSSVGDSIAEAGGSGGLAAAGDTLATGAGGAGGADGGDLGDIAGAEALTAAVGGRLPANGQLEAAPRAPADAASGADLVPKVVGTRPCELEARTARTGLGTVVFYATARVAAVPVVVLGFAPDPSDSPVTLLALAQQEGCRVVLEAAGP